MANMPNGDVEELRESIKQLQGKVLDMACLLAEIRAETRVPRATDWFYDVRFPIDIDNLYPAEYSGSKVKRWVGPRPIVSISFNFLADIEYKISIQIADFINTEVQESFRVACDGLFLPWKSSDRRFFTAQVSHSTSGVRRVDFMSDYAIKSSDLNPASTDTRVLSFSITQIRIEPVRLEE